MSEAPTERYALRFRFETRRDARRFCDREGDVHITSLSPAPPPYLVPERVRVEIAPIDRAGGEAVSVRLSTATAAKRERAPSIDEPQAPAAKRARFFGPGIFAPTLAMLPFVDRVRVSSTNRALRESPLLREEYDRGRAVQAYHRTVSAFVARHADDAEGLTYLDRVRGWFGRSRRIKRDNLVPMAELTTRALTLPHPEQRLAALHSLTRAIETIPAEERPSALTRIFDLMRATPSPSPTKSVENYDCERRIFATSGREECLDTDRRTDSLNRACEAVRKLPAPMRGPALAELHACAPTAYPRAESWSFLGDEPRRRETAEFTERLRRENQRLPPALREGLPAPDPTYLKEIEQTGII